MLYRGVTLLALVCLTACDSKQVLLPSDNINTYVKQAQTGRWYSRAQYEAGKTLFAQHCAVCHGQNAEQTVEWKIPNSQGQYPPPPLNGSAHAWHHPLSVLRQVIRHGGAPMGGMMPAWEGVLSEEDMVATIAAFQSFWPDEVYERWLLIDNPAQ